MHICTNFIVFNIVISSNKCNILQISSLRNCYLETFQKSTNKIFLKNNISNLHSEMAPSLYVNIHNFNSILKKEYKVIYLVSQVPGAIWSQLEIIVNSQLFGC